MSFKDRCWTEIDRSALRENLRILQSCVPDGCRLMGIVKADGYGHGAAEVAALFAGIPGSWLGVACLQEALDLRRAGIDLPILILGYTPPRQAAVLAENQLTQALLSPEYTALLALEAKRQGIRVMAHAAVDTGMGRIGYAAHEPDEAARALAADYGRAELEVTGIFTHFSSAYAQTGTPGPTPGASLKNSPLCAPSSIAWGWTRGCATAPTRRPPSTARSTPWTFAGWVRCSTAFCPRPPWSARCHFARR